jgi:hypothetical protein
MLRRGTPVGSTRRPRPQLAVVTALVAVASVVSGCIDTNTVPGVSEACTQPATLNDGFFANRGVFFRVSTQTNPADPQTTWICYRAKIAGQPEQAGRIDVNTTTSIPVPQVTNDLSSRACATGPNWVPGPHPIEEGEVLDTPFYIDAFLRLVNGPWTTSGVPSAGAWLCVEAGPVKQRVAVEFSDLNDPDVTANTDSAPPAPQDTTPPPTGKASTSCSTGVYGTASELVNAHLSGRDLFLYTARPSNDELHLCVRLSSPEQSGGGHLSIKAAPSQVVDVQQSPDTSPCTQDIVTLSNPPVSIKRSPEGQSPPSICVNGTRYTVVTGPVPPVVSFTADT